jgi:hypothetical protein
LEVPWKLEGTGTRQDVENTTLVIQFLGSWKELGQDRMLKTLLL